MSVADTIVTMYALRSQIQEINAALPETAEPLDFWTNTYCPNPADRNDLRCGMDKGRTFTGPHARKLARDAMRTELVVRDFDPCA